MPTAGDEAPKDKSQKSKKLQMPNAQISNAPLIIFHFRLGASL
jgi:hypothetical protein